MPGYWWACENHINCSDHKVQTLFQTILPHKSIAPFLWHLYNQNWDQDMLTQICHVCNKKSMRITFYMNPSLKEIFQVIHIVGIVKNPDIPKEKYMRMIWEMKQVCPQASNVPEFQFNYIVGNRQWGLKHPGRFDKTEMNGILDDYARLTKNPRPF